MRVLWLYLLAFMLCPIFGEIWIWHGRLTITATTGDVELALIISHVLYVFIAVAIAYAIQRYNSKKELPSPKFNLPFALRTVNRSIMLLGLVLVIIYMISGHAILHRIAGRGEVRASMMQGFFGIIYKWLTLYLPPGALIVNSIIYRRCNHKAQRRLRAKLLLLYCLAIFIGMLTGYKATFLIMIMGGIAVLTHKRLTLRRLLLLILTLAFGLVGTTMFVQNMDMIPSVYFLIHRMTAMSAYGVVAVWNVFSDGVSFDNLILYALTVFGNRLASLISGYSVNSVDFLPINPSRLITYMVYPNPAEAVMGTVNVTITNFGEAVYIFGRKLFFIHAVIAGLILGITIRAFRKNIMQGNIMKGMLWGVYFFSVVIPWVNGGNTWSLMGVPTIVWLLSTYIVIGLVIKAKLGPVALCLHQSLRSNEVEWKRCGGTR